MRPESLSANHLLVSGGTVTRTTELTYPLTVTIIEVVELEATITEVVELEATIEVCN